MERTLVFLLVFGMMVGNLFAGDANYREFVLREIEPAGDPLPVFNCEGDEDGGPFAITMDFTIGNPFGEKLDAKLYGYNPNTQEWTLQKTCTNIDPDGQRCSSYFPLVWGMSHNGTESVGFAKIEMSKGGDVYSRTFTFNMKHSETTQEVLIWERISYLSGIIQELKSGTYCNSDASVCCPVNGRVDDFDGVGERSIELGKECRLRESRQNVMDAINNAEIVKQDAASCSAAIEQLNGAEEMKANCNDPSLASEVSSLENKVKAGEYGITAGAAQAIYSSKCGMAPPVTIEQGTGPGTTSGTGSTGAAAGTGSTGSTAAGTGPAPAGSGCPAGFLLLAAAAFAFAAREE